MKTKLLLTINKVQRAVKYQDLPFTRPLKIFRYSMLKMYLWHFSYLLGYDFLCCIGLSSQMHFEKAQVGLHLRDGYQVFGTSGPVAYGSASRFNTTEKFPQVIYRQLSGMISHQNRPVFVNYVKE